MARLPTAEQLGQRPTPSPRGGIAPLNLRTPRRGQEAAALVQFGEAVSGLGDTLAIMAAKEKEQIDSARSEEGFTNYLDGQLELEYGEDGYSNILNGDAVKRPLVEEYRKKREALATEIRKGLGNDDQRAAFDRRKDIADRQFDARLYKHVADQTRSYQGIVSEGVKATELRMAALNWAQPGQIELSILRTNMEIERKARMDGLNPNEEGDRQVIDTLKIIAETQIHSSVVDQMILQGKDTAAAAYYERVKDRLTDKAITTLGIKVESSSVSGNAIRAADMAWEMFGPQNVNDVVRQDTMEQWVREQFKDDPAAMKSAIEDLRSRTIAFKDQQRELNAYNKGKVLEAFRQGKTIREMQGMPEYWAMDNDTRATTEIYMNNVGWTEQQRARAEASYLEGAKASNGFQQFWVLSNPAVLSAMSENEILALETDIGQTLTGDLMKLKRSLSSPAKVREATLDAALFNEEAANAGLYKYDKMSAGDKEILGRLKNAVLSDIDIIQSEENRKLGREEKRKLIQEEIDSYVMYDKGLLYFEKRLPAAVIKPDQRESVRVPIERVDPAWLSDSLNYLRSVEVIPQDMDDDVAIRAVRSRLEKAYAISITGGTTEEVRNALESD